MMTKRFLWALAASLLLHVAALWPVGRHMLPAPSPMSPLRVRLPPAEPDEALSAASGPSLVTPQSAVPPAPSLRNAPERTQTKPQPLQGRALRAALERLAREEFYPREAIARGLEGRVVLLLSLDESGQILRIEVASSSGHALLDDAARNAAARIGRVASQRRQVLLPVEFRLE